MFVHALPIFSSSLLDVYYLNTLTNKAIYYYYINIYAQIYVCCLSSPVVLLLFVTCCFCHFSFYSFLLFVPVWSFSNERELTYTKAPKTGKKVSFRYLCILYFLFLRSIIQSLLIHCNISFLVFCIYDHCIASFRFIDYSSLSVYFFCVNKRRESVVIYLGWWAIGAMLK
jgi:hypothetical protein